MRKLSAKAVDLSPERLAILLALAHQTATPPEIAGQVIADSVGAISIASGSLYRFIHDLERRNLIANIGTNTAPIYDLTPAGWRMLERELPRIDRYRQLLQIRLSPRQYKATQRAIQAKN